MTTVEALTERIVATGETIRALKASKGDKDALTKSIAELLALKAQYKELTGSDYNPPSKDQKKNEKKTPEVVAKDGKGEEGGEVKKSKKELNKEKKKAAKAAIKSGDAPTSAKPTNATQGQVGRLLPVPSEEQEGRICFSLEKLPLASYMVAILTKQDITKLFQPVSGPVIEPTITFASGEIISGDVAIARYLCRTYGMSLYGGQDSVLTSQMDGWMDFACSGFKSTSDIVKSLTYLDRSLQDRTYLSGYAITLADLVMWSTLHTFVQPDSWRNLPNVTRWWLHLANQPSFQSAASVLQALASTSSSSDRIPTNKGKDTGSCPPLKHAIDGQVVTRFPPEPSGFLHIGHLKACLLNDYYARHYHGKLILRFDDTNPSKEKDAFEQSIIADLKRLAIVPDQITYTSDSFPQIMTYARQLITQGDAYMDNTPQEQMREERMNGIESRCRQQSVDVNMQLFEQLITNHPDSMGYCLRGKIDMQAKNKTLRDPVLFRANLTPHHRTGTKYVAYPTYDLACPIVDSLEGVTHALRTTEYNDRDEQYQWVLKTLKLRQVHIHAFARMNFVYSVLSKRKLQWFVDNGHVEGWNDPRFPTIQGVLRRGVQVEALREFIVSQGASRRITDMEWDKFWTINKRVIDPIAPRYFALDKERAVPLKLTNVKEEVVGIPALRHPKNPEMGNRLMRFSNQLLIEYDDAIQFKEGEEVTLMRHGNIIIKKIYKDDKTQEIVKIDAINHPEGDFKKTKLKTTWLADVKDLVICKLIEFDHLLSKPKLEENDSFQDHLTKVTRAEIVAIGDHELRNVQKNEIIQLERRGFFRVDQPYLSPEKPLMLFMVPDGKAKAMSTLSTKLAHR